MYAANAEIACYLNESSLMEDLCTHIATADFPLSCQTHGREFDYASGRTDLIAICSEGKLHAFEGKLTKWRKALDQARKNQCFAHYTYVVLPSRSANAALRHREQFERHGIGLILLGSGSPKLEIEPEARQPFVPWLTNAATVFASQS